MLNTCSTKSTDDSKWTELNQDCSSQLPGCLPYTGSITKHRYNVGHMLVYDNGSRMKII